MSLRSPSCGSVLGLALLATLAGCKDKSPPPQATSLDAGRPPDPKAELPTEPPHSARVVARLRAPHDIATDGKALYVADIDIKDENDTAEIVKISLPDGRVEKLATKQRNGQGVVVVGPDLFWIVSGDVDRHIPDAIFRMPTAGGRPARFATTFVFTDAAIAAREGAVYFLGPLEGGDGSVTKLSVAPGSKPTKLADADRNAERSAIAVDATNVYWVETRKIMKAPIGGGPSAPVADAKQVRGMVSDGLHLYWTDMGEGTNQQGAVKRASVNSGAVEVLRERESRPWGIAVDDEAVYWVTNDDSNGAIHKRFKKSPPVFDIVGRQNAPVQIVVAGANVYWTNAGDGTVMMTTK